MGEGNVLGRVRILKGHSDRKSNANGNGNRVGNGNGNGNGNGDGNGNGNDWPRLAMSCQGWPGLARLSKASQDWLRLAKAGQDQPSLVRACQGWPGMARLAQAGKS